MGNKRSIFPDGAARRAEAARVPLNGLINGPNEMLREEAN